jgi:hypothetical protein
LTNKRLSSPAGNRPFPCFPFTRRFSISETSLKKWGCPLSKQPLSKTILIRIS